MGVGGPVALPSGLKEITGFRESRIPGDEPKPDLGEPDEPDYIRDDPVAHGEWVRVVETLRGKQVLTIADGGSLALLCRYYSIMTVARLEIAQSGYLVEGYRKYKVANPLARVEREAMHDYARMLEQFGLTPSSRSRIQRSANAGAAIEVKVGAGDKPAVALRTFLALNPG